MNKDVENLKLALQKKDLEIERYSDQIKALADPKINSLLEGILQNEIRHKAELKDIKVKGTFQHLARAAKGHKDAIGRIIRDIESDNHDVGFYCIMCGWEINFGKMPSIGNEERCSLCCQKFALVDEDNDYAIKFLPQ